MRNILIRNISERTSIRKNRNKILLDKHSFYVDSDPDMSGNPDKQPRSHRYHPGVYADYIIQIEFGLITLHAKIGNISETGICLILNGEDLNVTESVYGSVIEKKSEKRIEFEGDIVWASKETIDDKIRFVYGLKFREPLILTESLVLINLSLQDP
ncbi:type IV pilus assembly protein PilZ [Leptospira noguchii str. 1993005606]|uniref:Type IV pilus assembly protein PilZ n=3 Tax=Leptospira noguchii TaxID=28182 RepID=M6YD23_9LEPT|nr:type IV pilus assembly protein PilZ [Leptospira noguchii str. 2007001578]EMO89771.1 type IV pilus assembly protein PilZ [Leptospira noguchii str. 2001034031]EPE83784.1 type IV pilus assembly protein PilZ [Leptospira noguchii str. 1993005606]